MTVRIEYLKKKLIGAIIYNTGKPDNPKWIISDITEDGEYWYNLFLVFGSNTKTHSLMKHWLLNYMTGNDRTIKIEFMNEDDEQEKNKRV
jgi:hypothetical protein